MDKRKAYVLVINEYKSTVPHSWKVLREYLELKLQESCLNKNALETIRVLIQIGAVHEFIRQELDSDFRSPLHAPNKRTFKTHGAIFSKAIELASRCLIMDTPHSFNYLDPVSWGGIVLQEFALFRSFGTSKSEMIDNLQKENKLLSRYENPFDKDYFPATWRLIEDCRVWAERRSGDKFREVYWQPFLAIRGELPSILSKRDWVGNYLDDNGQLRLTSGKGKGDLQSKIFGGLEEGKNNLSNLSVLWW